MRYSVLHSFFFSCKVLIISTSIHVNRLTVAPIHDHYNILITSSTSYISCICTCTIFLCYLEGEMHQLHTLWQTSLYLYYISMLSGWRNTPVTCTLWQTSLYVVLHSSLYSSLHSTCRHVVSGGTIISSICHHMNVS